jgi:hypothetical protein
LRPLMAFPNGTGTYHLFVDACLGDTSNSGGLSAVLLQDQLDGCRRQIGYASRRLTASEQKYPIFLAEMQAAVFAMDYFHQYLIPARFKLYTDHKLMCKLLSAHAKTLDRLQVKMTELHPELQYIEGKDNIEQVSRDERCCRGRGLRHEPHSANKLCVCAHDTQGPWTVRPDRRCVPHPRQHATTRRSNIIAHHCRQEHTAINLSSTHIWQIGTLLPPRHHHRQRPICKTAAQEGFLADIGPPHGRTTIHARRNIARGS